MTTTLEDRVRDAFAHRAEQTQVSRDAAAGVDGAPSARVVDLAGRRPRTWQPVAVAATVIGVITVGPLALRGDGSDPPRPTVPPGATPIPAATGNILAIDLDGLPRTMSPAIGDGITYELPDGEALQTGGWTLSNLRAYASVTTDRAVPDGYVATGALRSPAGATFDVAIGRGGPAPSPSPGDREVMVGTTPALLLDVEANAGRPAIRWQRDDVTVTLTAADAVAADADLVAAAEQVRFTVVDELPAEPDTPPSILAPGVQVGSGAGEPELAGTLDGVAWRADVDESSLRGLNLSFADSRYGGGFASDRLNQPTDDPATGVELWLVGVPGHGAVAAGYAPPAAAQVRVVVGDETVATLATYRRSAESFFVVPVPEGLAVNRLVFVDEDGNEVGRRDVPAIPHGFGGTAGV